MAWALHVSAEQLETEMGELSDFGILDRKGSVWVVARFAERQAPSAAALRMRRYRERKKKEKKQKKEKDTTDTDTDTYRASRSVHYSDVTRYVTRYGEVERGVLQEFGAKALWADRGSTQFAERWAPYIGAWLNMAEGDAEKVVDIVRDVLNDDMGKYTITTPKSIRGEVARRLTGKTAGNDPDVDAAWEQVKNAVTGANLRYSGIGGLDLPPDIKAAAKCVGAPAFETLSQYTESKLKAQFETAYLRERHGTTA